MSLCTVSVLGHKSLHIIFILLLPSWIDCLSNDDSYNMIMKMISAIYNEICSKIRAQSNTQCTVALKRFFFFWQNILDGGKLNDDLFIDTKQRLIRQIVQGSSAE